MKEILKSKMMMGVAILLLGIVFIDAYIEKNDLSTANEPSQNEIINK